MKFLATPLLIRKGTQDAPPPSRTWSNRRPRSVIVDVDLLHVDGIVSFEVNLLEGGWYSGQRAEVVRVSGSQHLGHVPRVHENRLAARHAVVEPTVSKWFVSYET